MAAPLTVQDLGLQDEEPLNVLDLPQLYTQPSAASILATLYDLKSQPSSWGSTPRSSNSRSISGTSTPYRRSRKIRSEGVPAYLTKIVSSALQWIADDQQREEIWQNASQELSARSGRTAQGDLTRSFAISLGDAEVELILHEPALTADNLGLKTWASSYLLANRLYDLRDDIDTTAVLELGSGTGLLGMAAACAWETHIVMTDLPDIVPNLGGNLSTNATTIGACHGSASVAVLDWQHPDQLALGSIVRSPNSFTTIIAADIVYSPEQPALLASVIQHHLAKVETARVVIEVPIRDGFSSELTLIRDEFAQLGLSLLMDGEETGMDDWSNSTLDDAAEVRCWWSIWKWDGCVRQ